MEKVTVTVEITENNYSAYIDLLPGCVAVGDNFEQLQNNIKTAVHEHLSISREFGEKLPEIFNKNYELIYKFDATSILQHYKGIFTMSALERLTGINQRQLQRYASGESKPRKGQSTKIAQAFNKLGKELLIISL
jgi:predicted RNase H-like HicB family nuclease